MPTKWLHIGPPNKRVSITLMGSKERLEAVASVIEDLDAKGAFGIKPLRAVVERIEVRPAK